MLPAGQAKLQGDIHKLLALTLSPSADRRKQGQSQMAKSKQRQEDEQLPPAVRSLLLLAVFMFLLGDFLLAQPNDVGIFLPPYQTELTETRRGFERSQSTP